MNCEGLVVFFYSIMAAIALPQISSRMQSFPVLSSVACRFITTKELTSRVSHQPTMRYQHYVFKHVGYIPSGLVAQYPKNYTIPASKLRNY